MLITWTGAIWYKHYDYFPVSSEKFTPFAIVWANIVFEIHK